MKPSSIAWLAFAIVACGQAEPPGEDGNSGGGTGGAADGGTPLDASGYFPLEPGSTWTYRHLDTTGTTWDEIVDASAVDFEGRAAIKLQDNENLVGEFSDSLHVREDGRVLRIHKDVTQNGVAAASVDYEPGFLRWDDRWTVETGIFDWSYTRRETDAFGVQTASVRNFTFEVLATSTEVTVTAGTFDCVHVERIRQDTLETKQYWFADGTGKVRELNVGTGSTEELIEYQIE